MSANDIVISGMSGRFPMSRNVDEFAKNLFDGIDMVTSSEDRWQDGIFGFVNRMGRLVDYNLFDANYFGMPGQMVEVLDPQSRLLIEATHEAIIDAGINPQSLRGTRTGVYIGVSTYPQCDGYPESIQPESGKSVSEGLLSLLAKFNGLLSNRISYIFDFKGPSLITDTACSASLTAFNLAMNDLKLGNIDYAIVGGTHMTLQPFIMNITQKGGLCSSRGISAVLDESADGFVKADATACLFLQKKSTAKRFYASVLSSRVNIDGKKTVGMFYPSSKAQESVMVMAYEEEGIDPLKLTLIEAHCTGTKVGDPQEVKAIYNAYFARTGRKDPLPLGLLKSNIGHTEGCSGIAAIIKVLLCYENESIPPNINLKQIKQECKVYCPPLYPNTEILKYEPGMAGINNFGIGGVNGNVLIEPNYKLANEDNLKIVETIPRIVNICGRTEESVRHLFDFIENNPEKISRDFLALLADTMKYVPSVNSGGFPYRGSMIIKKTTEVQSVIKYEYKKQLSELKSKEIKPIWFLFPGLGGQWPAMAKALMPIKVFADKVEECHQILSEFGVNLKHFLLSEDSEAISTVMAKFCATICIELALFEVLKSLDITPDGIIGHSFGEIACAYADGCLNTRQAVLTIYFRGVITESDKQIPKGLMAVCGLTKVEARKLIPPEVVIACYNSQDTVVLSGPENQMKQLITDLKRKEKFVYQLESSGIPYHSHYLQTSAQPMIDIIKKYIPNPIKRSEKWISTSTLKSDKEELKYASAEYFVNNLISPVYFHDQFKNIPSDAIIIEIGPHGVFRKIVKDTLDSAAYISLMKKNSNETNLDHFLTAIASLYELGVNPSIENLYPRVEWPVSRNTQSIGSLMKWDHRVEYHVPKYPDQFNRANASDFNKTINFIDKEDKFYSGHCIDGNVILPATGYLMLAWHQFSFSLGKQWNDVPVVIENVQFVRPVFLTEDNKTSLKVRYDLQTCDFHVLENDNICCTGKIRSPTDTTLQLQHIIHEKENLILENEFSLETEDIYKELRCMGYDYSGEFKRLKSVRTNDFTYIRGVCEWNGNIVTFLDALLQSMAFATPFRKLIVPVMIKSIKIDPKVFFETVKRNRISEDTVTHQPDEQETDVTNQLSSKQIDEIGSEVIENIKSEQREFVDASDAHITKLAEEFCVYKADIPFYFNEKSKILVTHGIEVEEVTGFPIPRRMETSNLVLDSYQFIANDDNNAIEEYDGKNIIEYIEVCKSMAAKLKQKSLKKMFCDFNYQNISSDLLDVYRQQNNDNHVLFKIFDKINKSSFDENGNQVQLDEKDLISLNIELENSESDLINIISKNERLIRSLTDIFSENFVPKKELKVTEINMTSDLLAKGIKQYISYFQLYPIEVDYNLIVKSSDYVSEEFKSKSIVWNLIEDLNIQTSHLIVFRDSFDLWQLDLKNVMKKLIENIADNGFLMIVCKTRFTEPEMVLNSLKTSGKQNLDLEMRLKNILKTLESDLNLICNKSNSIGTSALLFRKVAAKKPVPEEDQIIEITGERQEHWFQMLKNKLLFAKDLDNKTDNVWLMARDSNINGIIGLMNCLRLEPGGENIRCIFDFDSNIEQPFDWNSKPFNDILNNDLVINVIKDNKLGTCRHLKLAKNSDKVVSDEYFLNISQTKDLSSLQWFDLRSVKSDKEVYDWMGEKIVEIPVSIYSSGLTFHDVMVATGRIPSGPLLLFTECLIGSEFAGRRKDTGERVMGFGLRCFATSFNANIKYTSPIPEHWSFDDAITILSTYSTAWYGLIERAGLSRGERILIHSGTGGVGQSAINICKHYNCDIYVTVGNEEKKQFLINEYNIPENRIFSSRDIQFKYKIKELTNGRGVDIVLNSLAGDKLDASYECLADSGRFVELGKFDLFQNKKIGMFEFLRDICFIGVSIELCIIKKPNFVQRFFDWMHKNCNNGCVKPLNKTVFNVNEAEKAFRYMTTGKHTGKIIIKIRDEEGSKHPITKIKPAKELVCTSKTYYDPNKVYIITGGLGGFGLELVHYMIYMGARKFLLTSRSGLKTDYQKYVINRLKIFGENNKFFKVEIEIAKNDCLTIESAKQVISEASLMGQIGGIFHSTLVLNDCLLQDLTYEKFCESIDTKHKILNNLDQITRKLSYNLDYFVVFSSIICGKGNVGQTNYAFGNSLCERICEQRRKDGLYGLAIQYGPIGDVGVVADSGQTFKLSTVQQQRINSCCDVLDKLLAVDHSVVTSFVKAERFTQGGSRQKRMIKEFWKALGVDPETTPDHLTLGEIGLESMFAVELQQEMEREFNFKIGLNHIKMISVGMLKDYENGRIAEIQKYLDDMKKTKETLSKFKFIIPSEKYSRLNNINTGKPIYLMPPFEITFSAFEEMVKNFDRPVIGLNWTKDMNKFETIKEIASYYTDLLKVLEPKGKYDLIGYFDGAITISKLFRKGVVNKAVIIDILSKKDFYDETPTESAIIKFLFGFMLNDLPKSLSDKIFREITAEPDLKSKIQKIVAEIKEICGRGLISTDMEEIFNLAAKRVNIISEYMTHKKKKFSNKLKEVIGKKWFKATGKLKVIKPFKFDTVEDPDETVAGARDLYFLPEYNESKDYLSIEGLDIENKFDTTTELYATKIFESFK